MIRCALAFIGLWIAYLLVTAHRPAESPIWEAVIPVAGIAIAVFASVALIGGIEEIWKAKRRGGSR